MKKMTRNVIQSSTCSDMYVKYKNACESAKATMGATIGAGQSLHDLYVEMLDKASTIGGSPSIENVNLLIEGRDHLYKCYKGRSAYENTCIPPGHRNYVDRRGDRRHANAINVFKNIWTSYNNEVRIMVSLIEQNESNAQVLIDMEDQLSTQRKDDVTQFLMGIDDGGRVTGVGQGKLRWSMYSDYTPTVEKYHRLLSICKFDQTIVINVVKVLHFFSRHDLELDHARVFELIKRVSKSDLVWSFLTLRRTDRFLRELVIQVGNQSYVSIPDMVQNLESILDDPSLVTTLLMYGAPVRLDGITLTLSNLSLVIRKEETSFLLHKFHLSRIVKKGKDIEPEWVKLSKMERMPQVADIVDSLGQRFVKDRGNHIFELFKETPRHGVNNTTQLVRGDYEISEEGGVTVSAPGLNLVGIKYVCLPLDTLHMKKFSGSSRDLGMNNVSRISRNGSVVPLEIPVRHFPHFTLTNIEDVVFK